MFILSFSCAVEAGLKKKFLTPNLINELVRDVCTSILHHTDKPKKAEREVVAKLIISSYPFLQAPSLCEESNPWGCFEVKLMNRFKKIQRIRTTTDKEKEINQQEKPKKGKLNKQWMSVPSTEEEDGEVKAMMTSITKEWQKGKKDHGKVKEWMRRTYAKRRQLVVVENQPLGELLKCFPPLQNMLYIKADFVRLMGNQELTNSIKSNFKDLWSGRVLTYAKMCKRYPTVLGEMDNAIDSGCDEKECQERAALKLASLMIRPPNQKVQSKEYEEAVIKIIPDHQSLDEVVKTIIQPVIILPDNLYANDIMYVAAEGRILCKITTKKIADGLTILLSTYYLYNIQYKVGKNIYSFLEMTLMGVTSDKIPVSVSTLIGILSNLSS